ncbi:hypothetical protein FRACYDRAFT_252812 [Fragilariopsis cylindrus CCMP1102]|uniref:CN hydrolase domain-containing protein n=1 Tax=Fragilariopsis cylindrus CCMP1102 TaxID=635003 RepID=A0A1E7EM13_9STRA|nr:hypothetical protein FRACYDRAFT_252812 [Fragilariopsis cylindrus CCMP1102]|eukprot:OEU06877.1 hypothetical protein FRACYDRAFT_252812 [Fragilariopsis cylindrus CCMP1102]
MSRLLQLLLLLVGPLLLSSVLLVPLTDAFLSPTIFYHTTTTSFFQNKLRRADTTTTTAASSRLESESELEHDGSVYGGDGDSETRSRSIKIRAAVFQPPISPKTKSVSSSSSSSSTTEEEEENNPLAILTKIADVLRVASMHKIDVVQFPELFINGVIGVGQRGRGRGQSGLDNNNNNNNVGLISNTASCTTPLDRECSTLNIKNKRQTTTKSTTDDDADITCYSSLAMFHADGSRAGNYRCVHPYHTANKASLPSSSSISDDTTATTTTTTSKKMMIFEKGHPLIEIMPISLQLPVRTTTARGQEQDKEMATSVTTRREVKIGAMCGGDILVPEHARHLARSGAEMFVVSGSFFYNNDDTDDANNDNNFSSSYDYNTNIAKHIELIRAPETQYGDMPASDEGYLLPCESGGALYAADIDIVIDIDRSNNDEAANTRSTRSSQISIEQWDLTPRIIQYSDTDDNTDDHDDPSMKTKGFGQEVKNVIRRNKKKQSKNK